jgi:hypothetical protein
MRSTSTIRCVTHIQPTEVGIAYLVFHSETNEKGRPATGRPSSLWEAVPTEAKPSELSGARVCSAPTAVKNVFPKLSSLEKSITYTEMYAFAGFFAEFLPHPVHRSRTCVTKPTELHRTPTPATFPASLFSGTRRVRTELRPGVLRIQMQAQELGLGRRWLPAHHPDRCPSAP